MSEGDSLEIYRAILTRWADMALGINHLGTLLGRELPLTEGNARAIDLAERAQRQAWDLFNDLLAYGAAKPKGYAEPESGEQDGPASGRDNL